MPQFCGFIIFPDLSTSGWYYFRGALPEFFLIIRVAFPVSGATRVQPR
jgi:hypothetical protein